MNLSVGIVGLPNVGKSTLFNALRSAQAFGSEVFDREAQTESAQARRGKLIDELSGGAKTANYPFTTIEPNVGVVEVPDGRLEKLADVVARDPSPAAQDDKRGWVNGRPPIIPAIVKFVDIAGLVKGAAQGEGLGNQFLSHIREVDVIVFVLRDFKNEDIIRAGSESPKEDLEVLKSELLLKDLETLNKRIETLGKELKSASGNDPRHQVLKTLEKAKGLVEQGKWLEDNLDLEEMGKISDLQLLSTKKTIIVLNSDEGKLSDKESHLDLKETSLRISAKMEEELASLSGDEQREYLKELGLGEAGLNRLIKIAYETLGLATFFTAGPKEVRAWTIKRGTLAPQAAGVIHTDFEKGFIAAEVIDWQKLVEAGGWQKAKTAGLVKTIGKSEEVNDGYVVEFRFSV